MAKAPTTVKSTAQRPLTNTDQGGAPMKVTFDAELFAWHADKATWIFVEVPRDDADAIDDAAALTGGFGSVKVRVQIGNTTWSTSLFPSKERETYVLPVKKAVRTAEGIDEGDTASISIELVHV